MDPVRIGIIGLGGIATRSHIPALSSIPDVVIQAGADINFSQAERTQRRFGIPRIYTDYKEMLAKESLEAVYICLPNFLHYDITMDVLSKGLHVYCEKPMGLSTQEASLLVNKANDAGLVLMPGFNLRYNQYFTRAHTLVKEKRLGKILQIHGFVAKPGPYIGWDPKSDWFFDKRNVGVLYDQGSHLLDLLLYVTGLKIEKLCTIKNSVLPGFNNVDSIATIFRCREGCIGSMSITWGAPANQTMIHVHGTAGSLIASDSYFQHITPSYGGFDKLATLVDNTLVLLKPVWDNLVRRKSESTYLYASQNFVRVIRGQGVLRTSGEDTIKMHRVLEAIKIAVLDKETSEWFYISA